MRVVFIGTVEVSWHSLKVLLDLCEVAAIYTMPQENSNFISGYAGFDILAKDNKVPLYRVRDINSAEVVEQLRAIEPEAIFCIGWPRLLKQKILDLPPKGCIGMHSSLLPKYRGGAPVNWGIIEGARKWGISLMYLGDGADNGAIIGQVEFGIEHGETCGDVYNKVNEATINILRKFVPQIADNTVSKIVQDETKATLYRQRKPSDGIIDWHGTALQLHNWIRALTHPYPGAFTYLSGGRKIFIWKADIKDYNKVLGHPGQILEVLPFNGVVVQCGRGQLTIKRVQVDGEIEMSASVWSAHMSDCIPQYFYRPARV